MDTKVIATTLIENPNVFYEDVKESRTINGHKIVLMSEIRKPTLEEIMAELDIHSLKKCNGIIVEDTDGYLYDLRNCAICGRGLGTV